MKKWFEEQVKRWLMARGYWIIPAGAPVLVISFGVGTMQKLPDGSKTYVVHMPPGHKLWAVNNTLISEV